MQNHKDRDTILSLLPGKNTRKRIKSEMLRVDHAGEYGAVQIYRGQTAPIRKDFDFIDKIDEMKQQEQVHLDKFNQVLPERKIRPSLLIPLWKRGGFLMGAVTALISQKSAMACTEAVETVIDKHYESQIKYFEQDQDPLVNDLKKFQQDELDHKHEAIESNANQAPFYSATSSIISGLCHAVIKIVHKI